MIVVLILLKIRNFFTQSISFVNSQKRAYDLIRFDLDWYTNFLGLPNLVEFLEFQKYTFDTDYYRLFCF